MQRSLSACLRATQLPQCWHGQPCGFQKQATAAIWSYALNSAWVQLLRSHWCQSCLPLKRLAMHQQQQKQAQDAMQPTKKSRRQHMRTVWEPRRGRLCGLPNTHQPERRHCRHDWRDEPHVVTIAGVILVIWFATKNWCADCVNASACFRRWCDRYVRYGRCRWHECFVRGVRHVAIW